MAEIDYTKPTWVNGSGQAIDATQLNAISTAVDQLTHATTRASAGKSLDADTVSGYGIGTIKNLANGYDLDTLKTNGLYAVQNPVYDGGTVTGLIVVFVNFFSASYGWQWIDNISTGASLRRGYNGSWYTYTRWDSSTDGNGGQPPAPKPFTTADAVGEWKYCTQYVGGASGDTGTWAYLKFDATGHVTGASVVAGGTDLGAGVLALCWKVASA